ncbi:YdcF family protein [Pollutimonas sp. H1-120]|uniref:YdcF family protein n=1 Tax=Pollutimonas sp. H1-120 TaxID=3148824 RepID=UPI003B51DE22
MTNLDASISYDALIVLANEMDANGILNEESVARADLAAEIARDLHVPYIITCGWAYRQDSKIKIADAFKDFLINKHSVSAEKIITEVNSRDTVGDAVFTRANIISQKQFRNICVVTSSYHVARTKAIFDFVYGKNYMIDVVGAVANYDDNVLDKEKASLESFNKTFLGIEAGALMKIIDRLKKCHPFYNGVAHASI